MASAPISRLQHRQPARSALPQPEHQRHHQNGMDGGASTIEQRNIVMGRLRAVEMEAQPAMAQHEIDHDDCARDRETEGERRQARAKPLRRQDPQPMDDRDAGDEDPGQPQPERERGMAIEE